MVLKARWVCTFGQREIVIACDFVSWGPVERGIQSVYLQTPCRTCWRYVSGCGGGMMSLGVLVEKDLLPSIVKLVTIAPAVAGQSARQVRAMARAQ